MDLEEIRARVAGHRPTRAAGADGRWDAATALILAQPPAMAPEILFIERTTRHGDRWSGQMALPGGRRDPADPDPAATARRETLEEVGIELGDPVGRIDDTRGRTLGTRVATFVFALDESPPLTLQTSEVATAVWIPVPRLLAREAAVHHRYAGVGRFPAVRHERFTIWGMTHGMLDDFFRVLGVRLPHP